MKLGLLASRWTRDAKTAWGQTPNYAWCASAQEALDLEARNSSKANAATNGGDNPRNDA